MNEVERMMLLYFSLRIERRQNIDDTCHRFISTTPVAYIFYIWLNYPVTLKPLLPQQKAEREIMKCVKSFNWSGSSYLHKFRHLANVMSRSVFNNLHFSNSSGGY